MLLAIFVDRNSGARRSQSLRLWSCGLSRPQREEQVCNAKASCRRFGGSCRQPATVAALVYASLPYSQFNRCGEGGRYEAKGGSRAGCGRAYLRREFRGPDVLRHTSSAQLAGGILAIAFAVIIPGASLIRGEIPSLTLLSPHPAPPPSSTLPTRCPEPRRPAWRPRQSRILL